MEHYRSIPTSRIFPKNRLYFGDCLDVMREDIPDKSIDLIYLDPPFNSKRLYNAFIGNAQWVAFNDTWRWSEAIDDFDEVASDVGMSYTMEGLRTILGGGGRACLSFLHGQSVARVQTGSEGYREHLSSLRSNNEPLLESANGWFI